MKKQTKKIIIGSVILLFLGAGSGVTYYVVNQGADNKSAKQETSYESATIMDATQADADIENETTDNVSTENLVTENTKDENTTETADKPSDFGKTTETSDKPNNFGKTTEEATCDKKPTAGTQNPKSTTTQAPKPQTGNNQQATTEAQNNNSSTTEAVTTECKHIWVAQYTTVYHPAQTHEEQQEFCVREAHTEDVYDWCYVCCACKLNMTLAGMSVEERTLHCCNCAGGKGSSYLVEQVKVGTKEVPAEYEMQTVTVVDKEAWEEVVLAYYYCERCGCTKLPDTQ